MTKYVSLRHFTSTKGVSFVFMNSASFQRITVGVLFLIALFSPAFGFAKTQPPLDPWTSLESGILQLHEKYAPDGPITKTSSFSEKITHYLEAGLWSTANRLLENSSDPTAESLRLKLLFRQGKYPEVYKTYRRDPSLFREQPDLLLGASQGAITQKEYRPALDLIDRLSFSNQATPERFYLSALAYWGLQEREQLNEVLRQSVLWGKQHPASPWASQLHLLKVYYHLNQKEYDLAFASMGEVFESNADLALLALTWGYFKLGSKGNLFSILQALDADNEDSRYHGQIFRILSRVLIEDGDLRGAVEMDQRERDELRRQMDVLEEETEELRRGISQPALLKPPGALLRKSLQKLQDRVGEKRDITALLWYIDLQQRRMALTKLKAREKVIEKEQRRLQMEMVRRCVTLHRGGENEGEIASLYRAAREAARKSDASTVAAQLEKILSLDPTGPFAHESAFRLGDMAFDRGDYQEAIVHYLRLLEHPDASLYSLALYKLAWAYYLQGDLDKAISVVIAQEIGMEEATQKEEPCVMIRTPEERREPFRLVALSLKALSRKKEEGPEHLVDLLKKRNADDRYAFFSKVVNYYDSEKKQEAMLPLIQAWIRSDPLYVGTPLLHEKMVRVIKQSDKVSIEAVIEARIAFLNQYQPGSAWAEANRSSPAKEEITLILKNYLKFLMTHYYSEGKKLETVEAYQKALPWYERYLSFFPEEDEIGRVRFLYAEILAGLKEDERAIVAYQKSAYDDPPHRMSTEAAYQEMLLLEKIFPATAQEIEEGYARFVTHFPEDPRRDEIVMRLAEMAFQRGAYEKSRSYARQISEKKGGVLTFRGINISAHRLIVQGYLKEDDFSGAIFYLDKLFSEVSGQDDLQEFQSLLVLSHFQHGEALKARGQKLEAAEAYWQAHQLGETSEMGPIALFEAASLWDTASTRPRLEEALQRFIKRYPKSSLYHPVLLRLGALYQEMGRLLKAAETYEKAAHLPVSAELSGQSIEEAISLYEAALHWEKVYELAMARGKQLSRDREKKGVWVVKAAQAKLQMGESPAAKKLLNKLVRGKKEKKVTPPAIAKAYFMLAELKRPDFDAIQLVAPIDKNLKKKKRLFDDLLHEYGHATDHPSPVIALHANYQIGAVFEGFSRALLESERPENLSDEEQILYDELLVEQALPFFSKAEEAYQENIDLGASTGLENEWIAKSELRLERLEEEIESIAYDEELG